MNAPDARHSHALEAEIITDPDELSRREALNGLRQFDAVVEIVEYHLHPERSFRLRPSHLLKLHRVALDGISAYAGGWRPSDIEIRGSRHQPAGAHRVPELIEELCDYVNDHWTESTPIHLASYVMWKLNWIHPFTDGNGRTSRAASYLVLCLRAGYLLPGRLTIPDQIAEDKSPYYLALEAADTAWTEKKAIDLAAMEKLLAELLARQLVDVLDNATGGHAADMYPRS